MNPRPLLATLCLLCVACSNVRAIGTAAGNVNNYLAKIEEAQAFIMTEASKPDPDLASIVQAASQSKSWASSSRSEINIVFTNLGGTTDEHSPWAATILWLAICGAIIALTVIAWRFGLDRLCYAVISWLPVKTKTKDAAAEDAATLAAVEREDNGIVLHRAREDIAVKRSKSKHYEEAFKAARKAQVKESQPK